jgi:hypothetical protein
MLDVMRVQEASVVLKIIRNLSRHRKYQEGKVISQFIARDVRRDVHIISVENIDEGVITGQVRTTNLLYLSNEMIERPEFGEIQELNINTIWDWTGNAWGGLPDGRSIVDGIVEE